ncbi:MAG TPA: peptidoglycan DD-metalloendopeptidase family protein [Gemmatimonadales bacterium]|nr:peptidoglycan DD-metalloendopeptidase family protein [Gemmatimonadales bacterium]
MRGVRLGLAVAVFAAAAVFATTGYWPWRRLPEAPPTVVARPAAIEPVEEILDTLRRGETVSHLFARHGVTDLDLAGLDPSLQLDPRRLRSGLVFSFRDADSTAVPTRISVRTGPERRIVFQRRVGGWDVIVEPIAWTTEAVRIEGAIDNSLYEALDAQVGDDELDGADRQRLAWDLADVYAWQLDFTRDIQPGDRFNVVFERLVSENGEMRFGRVLASDLTMSGKSLTAFRFEAEGRPAFYDAEGSSLRRAFLRAPVQFRRISSTFARSRHHPVLGITRRHEGTDYAASPGTPVMAAGDGVVLRAGRAGGYGNLVEIRHRNGITTRYGHLRGFARGVRAGARVEQGETIGYVGSTGLASGPHLHYEFRVNGVAKDSRRVELGNGAPISAALRSAFEQERDRLRVLLQTESAPRTIAQRATIETPARWLP